MVCSVASILLRQISLLGENMCTISTALSEVDLFSVAASPFRCEVPPPGYSPPTLAAPPSFNCPPPSVCGCTIASVPMPASFSLQHAQPASAKFVHVQAAGRAPVPIGGLPVPAGGASIPVGGIPVPVMYNICTPMTDQQQPYAISVCSSALRSTVVSQGWRFYRFQQPT